MQTTSHQEPQTDLFKVEEMIKTRYIARSGTVPSAHVEHCEESAGAQVSWTDFQGASLLQGRDLVYQTGAVVLNASKGPSYWHELDESGNASVLNSSSRVLSVSLRGGSGSASLINEILGSSRVTQDHIFQHADLIIFDHDGSTECQTLPFGNASVRLLHNKRLQVTQQGSQPVTRVSFSIEEADIENFRFAWNVATTGGTKSPVMHLAMQAGPVDRSGSLSTYSAIYFTRLKSLRELRRIK